MSEPVNNPNRTARLPSLAWIGVFGIISGSGACQSPLVHIPAQPVIAMAAQGPETADEPRLSPQQQQDIQWLQSILNNPANEPGTRAGAAERLMHMRLPQANAVLIAALEDGDDNMALAVAKAMQATEIEAEALLDASVASLKRATGSLLDTLAIVLARYDDAALERVAALAEDDKLSTTERLGPIHALGTFRSKAAAVELMALLDPQRDEPTEIIHAVGAALQRGTGLPYGSDEGKWRQWWAYAKDQPREQWMSNIVQRLSEQLAAAEQQIYREREIARRTENRLAEAYRNLFATLSFDDQLALLPTLLDDSLSSIRGFALDRVARLLRDSVRIGDELQNIIAQRLHDEIPALRQQTARLLDQLNHDQTSQKVAARLAEETDAELIHSFLDVLIRRPSTAAALAATDLLGDAEHGARASDVIWQTLLAEHDLHAEQMSSIRDALQKVEPKSPRHLRLLARVGDDDDADALESMLDHDDSQIRRKIAEGFLRRGHRQPLLDRAHDAEIYPFALRSLQRPDADFSTLRQLASMPPTEQALNMWAEAVEYVVAQLDADQLLEADELLSATDAADATLRATLLQRAANLPADAISSRQRDRLAMRLAQLYLDLQNPADAHAVLESVNGDFDSPAGKLLRFEAAALVGEYDTAASVMPSPEQWVELLTRIERIDANAALQLHDEIIRRFEGELGEDLKSEFEAVQQRLHSQPVESPA